MKHEPPYTSYRQVCYFLTGLLRWFLFVCLSFASLILYSQDDLDSLLNVFNDTSYTITDRIGAGYLYNLKMMANHELDSLRYYSERIENLIGDEELPYESSLYYGLMGMYYNAQSSGDSAMVYFKKSLEYYNQVNEDDDNGENYSAMGDLQDYRPLFMTMRYIGSLYYNANDFSKALEYYESALEISDKINNFQLIRPVLVNVVFIYRSRGNKNKAIEYINILLEKDLEGKNNIAIAHTYHLYGQIFKAFGDFVESLEYFNKALAISRKEENFTGIASHLNNMGTVYEYQGHYSKALECHLESLEIKKGLGDIRRIANSERNIGSVYLAMGNYDKALYYFDRSLAAYIEVDELRLQAFAYNLIAEVHMKRGNNAQAIQNFNSSLEISEKYNFKKDRAASLRNLGLINMEQGEHSKSIRNLKKSLDLFTGLKDQLGLSQTLVSLGEVSLKQNIYKDALSYCEQAFELAERIDVLEEKKLACDCLYKAHKSTGNIAKSFAYLEELRTIESRILYEETTRELQQMEFANQMYKDSISNAEKQRILKEQYEDEVSRQSQTRNVFGGLGILALLIAGGFYNRWRYVSKSRNIISKEKERSENLLLNILPVEIAEELKEKGQAEAKNYDMVSILFTDFKSFTETAAKLSASELVDEINHCFKAFDHIVEKYGVEKIKTIGDAYMAAGGLPVFTPESTKNTVLAALEMQSFIASRKRENDALGKTAFQMRAGIHTGSIVAGIVGVRKFQYDIWGDTVNTAARMESHGEVSKLNISKATYDLIKDDPIFKFDHRGKISAKGKGDVDMWFVSLKADSLQDQ